MVITASSKSQPQVVDLNVQPILNQAEVYSGCYGRVSLNFFAYNQAGNRGIGCGLNCIQKIADGDPLSGGVSAQEAFGGNNAYASGATPQMGGMSAQPYPGQQPMYQQPMYQQSTPAYPHQQMMNAPIDPITGQPLIQGGVMGIQ